VSDCPRCSKALESAQLDDLAVRVCAGCRGFLLLHRDLTNVIEASWRAVPRVKAEAMSFVAPVNWQKEPKFHCPDCQQVMDKYGYMGLAVIQIDRCDNCALVWLDADELQNMVLALAKTNYQIEQSQRRTRDTITPFAGAVPPRSRKSWLFEDDADGVELAVAQLLLGLLLRR